MTANLISLFSGIIFAIGLSISGMINPQKVIGFLDIFGQWDYSLVFVMGGAVGFNYFSFKYLTNKQPYCGGDHFLPQKKELDKRLIIGAALFGIGWGLIGICPGPGLVNLVTLNSDIFLFVGAMLVGMLTFKKFSGAK